MKRRWCIGLIFQLACSGDIALDPHDPCPIDTPDEPAPPDTPTRRPVGMHRWQNLEADVDCRSHTATALADGRAVIRGDCYLGGVPTWALLYDDETRTLAPLAAGERTSHTATRLLDGRVLFAGGRGLSSTLPSTELFDPTSDAFVDGPPMIDARESHAAERLADGRVVIAGGLADGTPTANVELWDGSIFVPLPPMDAPRVGATTALFDDGSVLIAGGGPGYAMRLLPATSEWVIGPGTGSDIVGLVPMDADTLFGVTPNSLMLLGHLTQEVLYFGTVPHLAFARVEDRVVMVGGALWAHPPFPAVFDAESRTLAFTLDGPELNFAAATTLADDSVLVVGSGAWLYAR